MSVHKRHDRPSNSFQYILLKIKNVPIVVALEETSGDRHSHWSLSSGEHECLDTMSQQLNETVLIIVFLLTKVTDLLTYNYVTLNHTITSPVSISVFPLAV